MNKREVIFELDKIQDHQDESIRNIVSYIILSIYSDSLATLINSLGRFTAQLTNEAQNLNPHIPIITKYPEIQKIVDSLTAQQLDEKVEIIMRIFSIALQLDRITEFQTEINRVVSLKGDKVHSCAFHADMSHEGKTLH